MDKYNTKQFEKDCSALGIELTEDKIEKFLGYYELLAEWNQFMNLTAITEYDDVMKKHFVDSISIVKADAEIDRRKVIDVGTGAGFPGIPMKIIFSGMRITLVDSLNKRVKFLNEVIGKLGLEGIETVHARAEDAAHNALYREKYDLCVSRAVANLSTLSEYCLPFVKPGGRFISYKSEKLSEEMEQAEKAISALGGAVEGQIDYMLPDSGIYRNLFIVTKRKKTPVKYPRKAGLPGKEPIR